jgi:hypothetical protein
MQLETYLMITISFFTSTKFDLKYLYDLQEETPIRFEPVHSRKIRHETMI